VSVPPGIFARSAHSDAFNQDIQMTLLIQANEIRHRSTASRGIEAASQANTNLERLKQLGICALAAVVSGLIAAAIIALQTAYYLHSLNY
jgi:hypothetical protein